MVICDWLPQISLLRLRDGDSVSPTVILYDTCYFKLPRMYDQSRRSDILVTETEPSISIPHPVKGVVIINGGKSGSCSGWMMFSFVLYIHFIFLKVIPSIHFILLHLGNPSW